MHDFQTLIAEHDHLDLLSEQLSVAATAAKNVAGILAIRSNLSMSLDDHLSKEDGFLYNDLIKVRQSDFPAAIARFHESFADLASDWADYLRGWDASCIDASWDEFAAETIAIMRRLRARIAEENGLLYPMALRSSRIRLRAA